MAFLQPNQPRQPFLRAPASVLWLIGALVLVHLAVTLLAVPDQSLVAFELVPARYSESAGWFGLTVPLVSHIFLHSGYPHLIMNCVWLLAFGSIVARRYGPALFIGLFLASGIAGAALHVALNWGSPEPALGASGAIAGLMAAGFRLYRWFGDVTGPRLMPIRSKQVLMFSAMWIIPNIGFLLLHSDIAGGAHIGGYLFGLFAVDGIEKLHLERARRRLQA
jgi:membrane associated rhomboid family serine protease